MTSRPGEETPPAPRVGWFDADPRPPDFRWRRDLEHPYLVHYVNVRRFMHEAAGRRWVFAAADGRTGDLDMPELLGVTERCPDCLDWARQHGHGEPDEEREDRRAATVAELDKSLNEYEAE